MTERVVVCKSCDLAVKVDDDDTENFGICPRCGQRVKDKALTAESDVAVMAISALIFLCISIVEPFMSLNSHGIEASMNLFSIVSILGSKWGSLLYFFLFFTFFAPVSVLCLIVLLGFFKNWIPNSKVGKFYKFCHSMCMVDVFVFGVAVSLIKLTGLADVSFHTGFYTTIIFTAMMMFTCSKYKPQRLWDRIMSQERIEGLKTGITAKMQGYKRCEECGYIFKADGEDDICPRCSSVVGYRIHLSIQKSFSLLIAALILYLPSNLYPVMYTSLFGNESGSNIIEGVIVMYNMGSWFVAGVILLASIFIPAFKIFSIAYLLAIVKFKINYSCKRMSRLFRFVLFVGRWSLIDVYVVIIMSAIVRIKSLIVINPGFAIICFCMVVIITVFSADSFDERLLWDVKENERSN